MNRWNEIFHNKDYVYGTEPNVFLKQAQSALPSRGNVLSIAEGEGRNAVYLAQQGLKVTAWDYAQSGLDKVKRLAERQQVEVKTELVDLSTVSWEQNQWDEIVCIFGHFPRDVRLKTLRGVREAVKPGGYFVAEVYSSNQLPYQSGGPKDIEFLYRPEEFLEEFSDWHVKHFFLGEVVRHEGDLHKGLSHVIQCVVQKPEN